jgi:hypothetical protein
MVSTIAGASGVVGVVYIILRACIVNSRAQSGEGIVSRSPPATTSVSAAMTACSYSVIGTPIAGVMTASLRIPAFLSMRYGPRVTCESSFCCKLVLEPSDRAPSIHFGGIMAHFLDNLVYSVAIQSATATQGTALRGRSTAELAGRNHLRRTTLLGRILVCSDFFRNGVVVSALFVFVGQKSRDECPLSSPEDASCKWQLLVQACRLAISGVGHGSEAWALRRQLAPFFVQLDWRRTVSEDRSCELICIYKCVRLDEID